MDTSLLLAILVSLAIVAATALFLVYLKGKDKRPGAPAAAREEPAGPVAPVPRRRGLDARAQRARAADAAPAEAPAEADDDNDEDFEDDSKSKKLGKKALMREEEKRRRREENERRLDERKSREEREAQLQEEARQERAREEEEERKVKEQLAKEEEERRKKEQEEYEKAKAMFVVETGGTAEDAIAEESQSLLSDFVNFIKTKKVVLLEDLAAHFGLKTKDAISRLRALEEMGQLTGFLDDRGKYVFVTPEELQAVAKWVRQRGRVSIADLAENSASLVRLSE
eukprot:m.240751 g.240751  ORF g.240751 m.240751 type:complete len:284 (+) comp13722_c0_seq1:14-865(+)